MRMNSFLLALATGLACTSANAGITVSDPWVRGVVAGQTDTGVYMKLTSTSDTTLVGVSSSAARSAQIHEMMKHGDMMMMHEVKKLPVSAQGGLDLDSSNYHIMLMGLKKPLAVGEKVPLVLTFQDAAGAQSSVSVQAVVRPIAAGTGHDNMSMHDGMKM